MDAAKITDAFFGKKFLDGCVERVFAVIHSGAHFDQSKEALKAAKAASVPESYAKTLREMSALSLGKFTKSVGLAKPLHLADSLWHRVAALEGRPVRPQQPVL